MLSRYLLTPLAALLLATTSRLAQTTPTPTGGGGPGTTGAPEGSAALDSCRPQGTPTWGPALRFFMTSCSFLLRWLPGGLALVTALLVATTAQAQRPAAFGTVTTYDMGSNSHPTAIAVADVNGDGKPDLLTANDFGSTVGVMLGTGTGSFGAVSTYSTGSGSSPFAIVVADVNGDGKPDLLTANRGTGTVGVLLGTGTGSFGAVSTYSAGVLLYGGCQGIVVADVNGDGKLDLLTANSSNSTAGVLLGTGTGSFGAATEYNTGSIGSIAVADVNGDGKPDLLTTDFSSNTVGVLLGTGTGSFGAMSTYDTGSGSQPGGIAVADVNGDGQLDLLTSNYGSGTAGVLLGTGTGSFGAVSTYIVGDSRSKPTAIAVADVNGDGKLDLLTPLYGKPTVGVLLGTGTGSFGAVSTYSVNALPYGIAVADLNGDGQPDLLIANPDTGTAGVLLNTTPVLTTRTFLPVSTYDTGSATFTNLNGNSTPEGIAVADVNRDGQPDLLTANTGTNTAGVLLGTGTGSFGAVSAYSTGGNSTPGGIAVADVNRDGKPDLLTANTGTNTAGVLLGTGTGSFGAVSTYDTGGGSQPTAIAVADVNGDGKLDLLMANTGTNTAGVLLGTGTGSFGAVSTYSTGGGSQPVAIVVADVNGDGQLDLLTANYISNTVGVLLGTGTGSFGAVSTYSTGSNSNPRVIAVADVNGDGKLDLLTANLGSTASVLLGTGTGSFGAVSTYGTGSSSQPYGLAVADVNGDGKLDLLTANYGTNTVGVLPGTGTGSFGTVSTYGAGSSSKPHGLAVADVNGDGKPDLLTANYGNNSVGVLLGGLDLVVSTTTPVYADVLYNSLIVSSTGVGTLAANTRVVGSATVQSGGVLNDGCFVLSGSGSFTLAAGGTLGICSAQGISSSGSTGSIQVTGTRSFDTDALYTYNGTAAQVTGAGLPTTVRTLTLANSAGLTLTGPVTASSGAMLSSGVLTTGSSPLTLGSAATISETVTGYATGTVQTTRTLGTAGTTQSFGGLGLSLTPSGGTLPGSTLVVRTTGTARTGTGTSQSVKRVFDIQPTVKTGLNVALALTVRDDERNNIPAANLRLFKSDDAGATWQPQPATVAATTTSGVPTYTASLGGVSNFSLWTLGDVANPLPVELVSFTATAAGPAAVRLAWATASEVNSQQFEVERSLDGTRFYKVGAVAAAGSSATAHSYAYLDAPAPAGQLYYRLRQVDTDGTAAYSPVQVVVLGGAGGLSAFPNPASRGAATLTGAAPGATVQVLDAVGRLVATATADAAGTALLVLPAGTPAGVYVVRAGQQALRLTVE